MDKKILIIIILVLLVAVGFLGYNYFSCKNTVSQINISQTKNELNEKVLNFSSIFVKDVLKQEGEIDFETRLRLENAVREIGDKEILEQWNKFINSKTEIEAQNEVKNLLEKLITKISAQ